MRKALLAVGYVLVVTPLGLLSRLTRDPLQRAWKKSADSYWIPAS
ncbi:hypothetical protein [Streptomyces sp. NPDC005407]